MAQINLLPWREELREQRKQEFFMVNGAVLVLAVIVLVLVWMFFDHILNDQQAANQKVMDANSQLDTQLKSLSGLQARRDEIVARMKVIQDLQGQRPVVVRVFDELPRLIPAHVYLTKFARKDDKFTFEGRAESPNDVSELLRNLEASPWFRNAFMNSFQGTSAKDQSPGGVAPRPEDNYGQFVVSADLKLPDQPKDDKGSLAAKTGHGGAS